MCDDDACGLGNERAAYNRVHPVEPCMGRAYKLIQHLGRVLTFFVTVVTFAETKHIPNPAPPGSSQAYLVAGPEGKVYLSWIEPAKAGRSSLRFAVRNNGDWHLLGTISEGANWFVNWADYPTLLPMREGVFAAHWLEKKGHSTYSYGIRLAQSAAGGASWKILFAPEVRQEGQYTGFASLVTLSRELGAAYLAPTPEGGEHDKALRFARFAPDGAVISDEMLDSDVCTCCQTAAGVTADGPIVAYRDHESDEIRDISVVAFKNGKWSHPRPVHRDRWRINACPVNGPALAASGNRVAVAWYTGADEKPRVYAAFSGNGGATFGTPARIDSGMPLGRVAVVLLSDGGAIVSWIEKKQTGGGEILVRRVSADGRVTGAQRVSSVDTARKTGFPKMALHGNSLILAWTDDRVRTVDVPMPAK